VPPALADILQLPARSEALAADIGALRQALQDWPA